MLSLPPPPPPPPPVHTPDRQFIPFVPAPNVARNTASLPTKTAKASGSTVYRRGKGREKAETGEGQGDKLISRASMYYVTV